MSAYAATAVGRETDSAVALSLKLITLLALASNTTLRRSGMSLYTCSPDVGVALAFGSPPYRLAPIDGDAAAAGRRAPSLPAVSTATTTIMAAAGMNRTLRI